MSLGSLYALIAVGYTMVYGILRLINFAHGDVFMMGVYFAFYFATLAHMPWWMAFVMAVLGAALLGFLIDRIAYKPLRKAPRISALITAIGMSFFLENLAIVLFSGVPKSFRSVYPNFFNQMIILGGHTEIKRGREVIVDALRIPNVSVITLLVTAAALFLLWLVLYKTRVGMAMRAIAMDIPAVALMGININMIIGVTFAIGSALAAVGGIFWAMRYPQIWPYMGFMPGLKAFVAAVIGGIGSVHGAVMGGLLLGILEVMLVGFFPLTAGYRDAFAFLILIVLLMFKPSGMFGKAEIVKV